MKKKVLLIANIICLMIMLACNHTEKKSTIVRIENDSIIFSNHANSYLIKRFQLHENYFSCYLNYNNKNIEVFHFGSDSLIKQYSLQNIYTNNVKLYPFNICLHNFDSIFIVLDLKNIILIDSCSNVQKHWNLDSLTDMDVNFVPTQNCPLDFCSNKIIVGNSTNKYVLNNQENRKKYYQEIIPDLILDIKKDSVYNSTGKFPDIYSNGNDYYDFYPYRYLGTHDTLIYSFGLDKRIYVYNASNRILIGKYKVESDYYSSPTPISNEDVDNFSRLGKYLIQQFRFKQLFWDDFNHVYYRLCYISTDPVNDKGRLNKFNNWSLIIMDKSFGKIGEVYFNSNDYYPIIYVYNGVLLILRKTSPDSKETIFDKFKYVK